MDVPKSVYAEWEKQCKCCTDCNQDFPCAGVMRGGMCDDMCECDYVDDCYGDCDICFHELDEYGFCENCLGEGLKG